MNISQQIKELRQLAEKKDKSYLILTHDKADIILEAADTIESLSAKLQASDMERSAEDCGGWIPCIERLPEKSNSYLVTKHIEESEDYVEQYETCSEIFWTKDNKWDCERDPDCEWKVIAWQPLPEPYHEP